MAQQQSQNPTPPDRAKEGITRITVGGFKSIVEEQSIEVRPLTILAGANSSGKSSIMQPLLLLKQTLEAPYDPGALLLNGPNVRFTLVDQLLSRKNDGGVMDAFNVGVGTETSTSVTIYFKRGKNKGFEVEEVKYNSDKEKYRLYSGMPENEIKAILYGSSMNIASESVSTVQESKFYLMRQRCFLVPAIEIEKIYTSTRPSSEATIINRHVRQMIHLPGLRGNPERTYPVSAVSTAFPGTFENYVASVINQWQTEGNTNKLEMVTRDLLRLGLTNKISTRAIDDTQIELLVSRFPYHSKISKDDMVSIADVGLGVSQALPVVVALHAANREQLVYLEQPEIHLHPRAQSAMAEVLANAVLEGKRVVVETHSSLLLLGIQTLVAEGKLPPEMVKLHWFTQQEDGSTKIDSADLDEAGTFGDWPEDFAKVALDSESRYIDASYEHLKGI